MASAVLVGGNEAFSSGEGNVYLRTYNNKKPTHFVTVSGDSMPIATSTLDEDIIVKLSSSSSSSFSRGGHVTFDLSAYPRSELKALRERLVSELRQVRELRSQIESSTNFSTRPVYQLTTTTTTAGPRPVHPKHVAGDKQISRPSGKKKKGSGAKRVNPFGNKGPGRKKRSTEFAAAAEKVTNMKKCGQMLSKLMKHKHGCVFNTPVDAAALGLFDYHQVIKNPMDLGTVKTKLEKGLYNSPLEFAADVRLTFNNALTYNPTGHRVYLMAELLAKKFDQMFVPAYNYFEGQNSSVLANVITGEPQKKRMWQMDRHAVGGKKVIERISTTKKMDSILNNKPHAGGEAQGRLLKKPKAKDPNKREMSLEEKVKLGMSLQELPREKMAKLMHIVRKRNGCFVQEGDEIELDIEAIDNETLWELDRFVGYYKRMAGKNKKQDGLVIMRSQNKSPVSVMAAAAAVEEEGKGGDAMEEEDVDIGEDIPGANFPPVEIERNDNAMTACASNKSGSSSSPGSSSESSQSDSGSGSSCGSDSDADNRK